MNSRLGSGSIRKSSLGQQAGHQPEPTAHLVVAQAGGEDVLELLGRQLAPGPGAGSRAGCRRGAANRVTAVDRVRAGVLAGQGLDEQVGQVEHLDAAAAQRLGERVVLLLRPAHPRDAVEEQLVVVARGQPLELGTGPVQHHRAQPADLAGDAVASWPGLAHASQRGAPAEPASLSASSSTGRDAREDQADRRAEVVDHREPHVAQQHPAGEHGQPGDGEQRRPGADEDADRVAVLGDHADRQQLGEVAPLGGEQHQERRAPPPSARCAASAALAAYSSSVSFSSASAPGADAEQHDGADQEDHQRDRLDQRLGQVASPGGPPSTAIRVWTRNARPDARSRPRAAGSGWTAPARR